MVKSLTRVLAESTCTTMGVKGELVPATPMGGETETGSPDPFLAKSGPVALNTTVSPISISLKYAVGIVS